MSSTSAQLLFESYEAEHAFNVVFKLEMETQPLLRVITKLPSELWGGIRGIVGMLELIEICQIYIHCFPVAFSCRLHLLCLFRKTSLGWWSVYSGNVCALWILWESWSSKPHWHHQSISVEQPCKPLQPRETLVPTCNSRVWRHGSCILRVTKKSL